MIQKFQPGPVEDAPPPPAPYVVPRMGHVGPIEKPQVWRVVEAELPAIYEWIIPLLRKKHPDVNPDRVVSFMRNALYQPGWLVCRTDAIVGLFGPEASTPFDMGVVTLKEVFVRSREKAEAQEALLYGYARDYAASIGCPELIVGVDTDCAMQKRVVPSLFDPKRNIKVRQVNTYVVDLLGGVS